MIDAMRRLHPRGATCRGVAIDGDGAMLGPDCVLVSRSNDSYRPLPHGVAATIQARLIDVDDDPDWLFEQCRRIAEALGRREIALAQIYGLRIPIGDLGASDLQWLRSAATLLKANFDPNQPRIPARQPGGGRWTDAGGGAEGAIDADGTPAEAGTTGGSGGAPADVATDGGAVEPTGPDESSRVTGDDSPPLEFTMEIPRSSRKRRGNAMRLCAGRRCFCGRRARSEPVWRLTAGCGRSSRWLKRARGSSNICRKYSRISTRPRAWKSFGVKSAAADPDITIIISSRGNMAPRTRKTTPDALEGNYPVDVPELTA